MKKLLIIILLLGLFFIMGCSNENNSAKNDFAGFYSASHSSSVASSSNPTDNQLNNTSSMLSSSPLSSTSSGQITVSSVYSPETASKINTTWSFQGKIEPGSVNVGRPIYGLEFALKYDDENKTYTSQESAGDCDKIDYYLLTNHSMTVAIKKENPIEKMPQPIGAAVMMNSVLNSYGNTEYTELYDDSADKYTVYNTDATHNYIILYFDKDYAQGQIRDLHFIWGKID